MQNERSKSDEKMAKKAGWASFLGTTIEWYDFYIYGLASALVIGPLFFSEVPDSIGVLLSFGTFWIGFLARPLGGIFFGHLGDRIGRKRTLVMTLLIMGVSTVGIGLLPTYQQIGLLAPVLLILLRMFQGFAVGGEWGGAVLIATEHAKRDRGFLFGAFAQQGSPAGRILATLAFIVIAQLPSDALLGWGWRVPFLASAVLIIVGLVIRLSLEESPAVVAMRASNHAVKVPIFTLFRDHSRTVFLGISSILVMFAIVYARDTFALAWATAELGLGKDEFLTIILIASIVQFCVQPFGAVFATRWGARRVVTILLLAQLPTIPLMFLLIGTGNWTLAMLGVVIATIPDVMYYAILAGMCARVFPANVRYTGISAIYGFAGAVGALAPLILQSLFTWSGSILYPIVFVIFICVVSLLSARVFLALPDPELQAPLTRPATVGTEPVAK